MDILDKYSKEIDNIVSGNNNSIICIVGKSASGKDTISKEISNRYNIPMLVSYTTRDKRENEINGREHWFISNEKADMLLNDKDNVLAYTEINGVRYFGLLSDINGKVLYVIDPNGVKYLRDKFGDKVDIKVIYVYCNDNVRAERAKKRDIVDYNKYWDSRCESEREMFREFEREGGWDLGVDNSI